MRCEPFTTPMLDLSTVEAFDATEFWSPPLARAVLCVSKISSVCLSPRVGARHEFQAYSQIDICPFDNAFVVKRVTGSALMAALENSISDSHMDGRFLQCSGIRFVGNWKKRQGERVTEAYWVTDNGSEEKLRSDRSYTAAMTAFIAGGFDGYTCFKGAANIIDEEGAMTDTTLLLQISGYKSLEDTTDTSKVDETSEGIERARKAIIIGVNTRDQLPTISPVKAGRIKLYESAVM
jgi:5'-nucleotidase, C-terminal domain